MEPLEPDDIQDNKQLLIEDFIATRPQVQIGRGEERWECTAKFRGSTIWITREEPLPIEAGESVDLYCRHTSGTYRFVIDIVESDSDRLIATRSANDPMGWRLSVRGRIRVPLTLKTLDKEDTTQVAGHTIDLSRSGTLIAVRNPLALGGTWQCDLALTADLTVHVDVSVIRSADVADEADAHHYGLQFIDPSTDVQRELFDFIMSRTDVSQIPSTSE